MQLEDMKIYFLEVENEDEFLLKSKYPRARIFGSKLDEDEIIKNCLDAEVLCVFIHSRISQKVINALPNLKLIVTRSVGYDHIDLTAARQKNVVVCNVPDYGSHVIAEHVFALLLSGLRHVNLGGLRVVQDLDFSYSGLRGTALKGKTLGIVGAGRIGKIVARIGSLGFLMNVLAFDPLEDSDVALENHFQYTDLETLLSKSDIISLHCPLLQETKHLIDENAIKKMKNGAVIVNTSRGGVIDTNALVEALKSKKISCAFLDVLEHENNLNKDRDLLDLKNVIITPHIAFYADDSMGKMYSESFLSIDSFRNGEFIVNKVES